MNTWILEYLNTWILEYLNTWILLYFVVGSSILLEFLSIITYLRISYPGKNIHRNASHLKHDNNVQTWLFLSVFCSYYVPVEIIEVIDSMFWRDKVAFLSFLYIVKIDIDIIVSITSHVFMVETQRVHYFVWYSAF